MTSNITSFLDRLANSENSFDLNNVMITLDGRRVVIIDGKEKDLKTLANKIITISSSSTLVDQLSANERLNGIQVVDKIAEAYRKTDQKIQSENIFTRTLIWMRESFSSFFTDTRKRIETEARNGFRSYGPNAAILISFGSPGGNWDSSCRMYFSQQSLLQLSK